MVEFDRFRRFLRESLFTGPRAQGGPYGGYLFVKEAPGRLSQVFRGPLLGHLRYATSLHGPVEELKEGSAVTFKLTYFSSIVSGFRPPKCGS